MTDFEVAVERLTAWLRDYGPTKNKPFVDDITIVLYVAKESARESARLAAAEARIESLLTQLRHFIPEPGVCEHGVVEGDWCEPCNQAYKEAAKAAGGERWLTNGQYAGHAVR